MSETTFKICTKCGDIWSSLDAFLSDQDTTLVGYQVDWASSDPGYFLFNHTKDGCGTTLALDAGLFEAMSSHRLAEVHGSQAASIPDDCLYSPAGEPCPRVCECHYVKDVCSALYQRMTRQRVAHRARTDQTQGNKEQAL